MCPYRLRSRQRPASVSIPKTKTAPARRRRRAKRPRTAAAPRCGERVNVAWKHGDDKTVYYLGTVTDKIDWERKIFRVRYDKRSGHKTEFSQHTFDDPCVKRKSATYPIGQGGSRAKSKNNAAFVDAVSRLDGVASRPLAIDALTSNAQDFLGLRAQSTALDLCAHHSDFAAFARDAPTRGLAYDAIYVDACGLFDEESIRAAIYAGRAEGFVLAFTFCTRDPRNTKGVGTYDRTIACIFRYAHERGFTAVLPADGSGALSGTKTYTDGGVTMSFGVVTLHGHPQGAPDRAEARALVIDAGTAGTSRALRELFI